MAESFGNKLKSERRSKGISQRGLAEKIGVDFSYISKVENDRLAPPSAETIEKIADALEISKEELLSASGKIPTNIKEMFSGNMSAIEFINEAQKMGLSDKEWKELSKSLKKLR